MIEGIIYKSARGLYYVETDGGILRCKARGRFRLENIKPLVGDRVEVTPTEPGMGVVTEIITRKNEFIRPPVANIEIMVIIASAAVPVTQPFLIDKMTSVAVKNGCEAIICINKCDIDRGDSLFEMYATTGFKTIRTSAETGQGRSELLCAIEGRLCAFTGNSGVGKSSILNMLDTDFNIDVGGVSKKLGRGRHTTRHVELYKLSNNAIIADTPGFSSFSTELELTSQESLQHVFPEFTEYIGKCRFLDCAHVNEPGCAILKALHEGKIQQSRHNSYKTLYEEAGKYKEWEHKTER